MASYPVVFTVDGGLGVKDDASYWYICNAPYGLKLLDLDLAVKTPSAGAMIMIDIEKSTDAITWTSIVADPYVTGTHDGGDDKSYLVDSSASFPPDTYVEGDLVPSPYRGLIIENTTDGSSGIITAVPSSTTIYVTLAGGTDNDWDNLDIFCIAIVGGIEAGEYIGTGGAFVDTEIEEGTLLRLDVEQCGVGTAGADLSVSLRVRQ